MTDFQERSGSNLRPPLTRPGGFKRRCAEGGAAVASVDRQLRNSGDKTIEAVPPARPMPPRSRRGQNRPACRFVHACAVCDAFRYRGRPGPSRRPFSRLAQKPPDPRTAKPQSRSPGGGCAAPPFVGAFLSRGGRRPAGDPPAPQTTRVGLLIPQGDEWRLRAIGMRTRRLA